MLTLLSYASVAIIPHGKIKQFASLAKSLADYLKLMPWGTNADAVDLRQRHSRSPGR